MKMKSKEMRCYRFSRQCVASIVAKKSVQMLRSVQMLTVQLQRTVQMLILKSYPDLKSNAMC